MLVAVYIHITIHYITLHYISLHYIILHYITLHDLTLHYITCHCVTLLYITLHCLTLPYITLHYITLHYITLHCVTLPHITLHCLTLPYITLHYITLHKNVCIYIYIYMIVVAWVLSYRDRSPQKSKQRADKGRGMAELLFSSDGPKQVLLSNSLKRSHGQKTQKIKEGNKSNEQEKDVLTHEHITHQIHK